MSAERLNNLSAKGLAEGDRYYCNPHFSQALSSEGAEEQRGRGVEGQRGRGVEEQRGKNLYKNSPKARTCSHTQAQTLRGVVRNPG